MCFCKPKINTATFRKSPRKDFSEGGRTGGWGGGWKFGVGVSILASRLSNGGAPGGSTRVNNPDEPDSIVTTCT